MKQPWSKFFWSDYDADEGLRLCSLAAQGLWMRMLCLMARAAPKGELRIGNEPCTVEDLSQSVGQSKEMVTALLGELSRRGVYSITRNSIIFCRRMRSEDDKRRKNQDNGKKGGNPNLLNQTKKTPPVNPSVKPEVKAQKPEAISHIPETTKLQTAQPTVQAPEPVQKSAALCVSLGQRITDLMGVSNDPRWVGNWSIVNIWLSQGYDAELDIWPTVSAIIERKKRSNQAMPTSLKYFSHAIDDNYKLRTSNESAAKINPELVTVRKGTPQFRAWIAHYKSIGRRTAFSEKQDVLTVPSEFPPSQSEAA